MADILPTHTKHHPGGQSRPAVIIAALLYLIAAYQRTPCPCVALCIVRHLECLAVHAGADPVIRQICAAVRETWARAALSPPAARSSSSASGRDAGPAILH